MRTGLIIFGVIFLVIGGLLYFVPNQVFRADTVSSEGGNVDTRTSSAVLTIPIEWTYASVIIGGILLIFGFVIPGPNKRNNPKNDSYNQVIKSKEKIKIGENGNKSKMTNERIERHRTRDDD